MKVIIIGAGMAGLSAAAHLEQNGITDFLVLEARSQIGGRFLVQKHGEHSLHMGAQWVHGIHPRNSMFQLAKKYGILNEEMERDGYGDMDYQSFDIEHMYTQNREKIPEKCSIMAGEIHSRICTKLQQKFDENDDKDNMSIEDFFQAEAKYEIEKLKNDLTGNEYKMVENSLYGCFRNILIGYTGDEIKNCHSYFFGSAEELPGGDLILPQKILDVFPKEIPYLNKNLKLNVQVETIFWNEKEIKIRSKNGEIFTCDFCICTFPPGVIQKSHETLFDPKLPQSKIEAYNSICPGAVSKYFIEWDEKWRDKNDHPFMFAWSKNDIEEMKLPKEWIKGVFEISVEDPLGTLMMVWVVGDAARAADDLDDETIKRDIGNLMRIFIDPKVPDPDHLYRHCWTKDEFALGAYSAPSLKCTKETFKVTGTPLPNDANPRLMFAGEATHPNFWSFMHGARESGIREAQRILNLNAQNK